MVGPHHWNTGPKHQAVGGHRRKRLVKVDHVETTPAHRALGAHGCQRGQSDRRDRAVGADAGRTTDHDDVALPSPGVCAGGHPGGDATLVGRSDDGDFVSQPAQRTGEPQDLTLHAARSVERVRRHHRDPHRGSLGQCGWKGAGESTHQGLCHLPPILSFTASTERPGRPFITQLSRTSGPEPAARIDAFEQLDSVRNTHIGAHLPDDLARRRLGRRVANDPDAAEQCPHRRLTTAAPTSRRSAVAGVMRHASCVMRDIDGHRAGRHVSRPHPGSRAGRRHDSSHHSRRLVPGSPATSIPVLIDHNPSRVLGEVAHLQWSTGDGLMAIDSPSRWRASRCARGRRLVVLRRDPVWPSGPTSCGRRPTPTRRCSAVVRRQRQPTGSCGQALGSPLGRVPSASSPGLIGMCHRLVGVIGPG